jgi:hypothetical protein
MPRRKSGFSLEALSSAPGGADWYSSQLARYSKLGHPSKMLPWVSALQGFAEAFLMAKQKKQHDDYQKSALDRETAKDAEAARHNKAMEDIALGKAQEAERAKRESSEGKQLTSLSKARESAVKPSAPPEVDVSDIGANPLGASPGLPPTTNMLMNDAPSWMQGGTGQWYTQPSQAEMARRMGVPLDVAARQDAGPDMTEGAAGKVQAREYQNQSMQNLQDQRAFGNRQSEENQAMNMALKALTLATLKDRVSKISDSERQGWSQMDKDNYDALKKRLGGGWESQESDAEIGKKMDAISAKYLDRPAPLSSLPGDSKLSNPMPLLSGHSNGYIPATKDTPGARQGTPPGMPFGWYVYQGK